MKEDGVDADDGEIGLFLLEIKIGLGQDLVMSGVGNTRDILEEGESGEELLDINYLLLILLRQVGYELRGQVHFLFDSSLN